MKFMGIEVEEKLEGGVKFAFCCDDESKWVMAYPASLAHSYDHHDGKIKLEEGMVLSVADQKGGRGGKITSIDYANETLTYGKDWTITAESVVNGIGVKY